ncbi:hypothetical protein Br6_05176 [Rhodococcus sp. Br-6]|nr:hypothetical protein Br6_05176 [Rhodococcus sp. Br-6]
MAGRRVRATGPCAGMCERVEQQAVELAGTCARRLPRAGAGGLHGVGVLPSPTSMHLPVADASQQRPAGPGPGEDGDLPESCAEIARLVVGQADDRSAVLAVVAGEAGPNCGHRTDAGVMEVTVEHEHPCASNAVGLWIRLDRCHHVQRPERGMRLSPVGVARADDTSALGSLEPHHRVQVELPRGGALGELGQIVARRPHEVVVFLHLLKLVSTRGLVRAVGDRDPDFRSCCACAVSAVEWIPLGRKVRQLHEMRPPSSDLAAHQPQGVSGVVRMTKRLPPNRRRASTPPLAAGITAGETS